MTNETLNDSHPATSHESHHLPLHPDHLQDLRKSGLSDEIIQEAKIYSAPPTDITKKITFNDPKIESLLCFPYPGCDGFERYKPFPSFDRKPKYLQKKGTGNRLYIPERVRTILPDPTVPLYITEGEKKTLKAIQEGLNCIGLGGLWNWSDGTEDKNLIPDFDQISFEGRSVFVVPDNDLLTPNRHGERKNLREAVQELAFRLIDRGARVSIVELPEGTGKGLDDFLCHHSLDEFKALPKKDVRKQTLDEMIEEASPENLGDIFKRLQSLRESEKEILINRLSEKLGIPKKAIRVDLERIHGKPREKDEVIEKLLESESLKQNRFSAIEVIGDRLLFGGIWSGEKILLRSDAEIVLPQPTDSFRFTRSNLTPSAAKRYKSGEMVRGINLIERLTHLISSHVIFKDSRIPLLLALWTMGTYFFKVFRFYGYLLINSPVKRCGKSLLLDILSHVCFNATSRLVNPSEASVFREVDGNDATLIIDEVESLGEGDRDRNSNLISLLNAGFQRGSQAPRIEKKGNIFETVYFNAYSPKVFVGISEIVDTIEDRSFRITMARKLRTQTIERFNLRRQEHDIEVLRQDLYIWALRNGMEVAEVYESSEGFNGIESIDDRQKDILEPLLSIACLIDAELEEQSLTVYRQLVDLALDMSEGRLERDQLDAAAPAIAGIGEEFLDGEAERFVSSDDLWKRAQQDDALSFVASKKALSTFLAKFDLHPSTPRKQAGKSVRGYVIRAKWVEDLKARYG